jgi:hypothetical protein
MAKYAVMGGLVTDEAGEPVVGASVRIYSLGPTGAWDLAQSAVTDDRGRYRVWTLRAGPRIVAVQPSYTSAPRTMFDGRDGSGARDATAARQLLNGAGLGPFAAGTVEVSGSVVVASGAGTNAVISVDGQAQAFRTAFHNAGAIVPLAAGEVAEAVDVQIVRCAHRPRFRPRRGRSRSRGATAGMARQCGRSTGRPLRQSVVTARTVTAADGRFEFAVVPVGRYVLKILQRPAPPPTSTPGATVTTAAGAVDVGSTTLPRLVDEACPRAPRSGQTCPSWPTRKV